MFSAFWHVVVRRIPEFRLHGLVHGLYDQFRHYISFVYKVLTMTSPETSGSSADTCSNLLLSSLPEQEFQSLLPHLERIKTPLKFVIAERDQRIQYVYFPLSGSHSILAIMEDGASIEIGTVGYEGISTIEVLTGAELATGTVICQIAGECLRLPLAKFKEAVAGDTALRQMCFRYLQAYLSQVSQSVACNRLHTLEQRFARWILMSHDRVPGDTFQLTQEFLADMLGVYRPSVSVVAQGFQQAGLITYNRGTIHILDRQGLEGACCECYGVVRKNFERALGKSMS